MPRCARTAAPAPPLAIAWLFHCALRRPRVFVRAPIEERDGPAGGVGGGIIFLADYPAYII